MGHGRCSITPHPTFHCSVSTHTVSSYDLPARCRALYRAPRRQIQPSDRPLVRPPFFSFASAGCCPPFVLMPGGAPPAPEAVFSACQAAGTGLIQPAASRPPATHPAKQHRIRPKIELTLRPPPSSVAGGSDLTADLFLIVARAAGIARAEPHAADPAAGPIRQATTHKMCNGEQEQNNLPIEHPFGNILDPPHRKDRMLCASPRNAFLRLKMSRMAHHPDAALRRLSPCRGSSVSFTRPGVSAPNRLIVRV